MSIWKQSMTVAEVNAMMRNTLAETLDIRCEEIGDDFVRGSMVVDPRTHQPYGILHGGASVALAETLGSLAAAMSCEEGYGCVGLEVNANHLRKVVSGRVMGTAKPLHIGRSTQVWEIRIADAQDRPVCVSRLTMSVITRP